MNTTTRIAVSSAALGLAALALAGCVVPPSGGPRVTESHEVSSQVHGLRLETGADVEVVLGDEPGLEITGPKGALSRLTVEERGGTLVLGSTGSGFAFGNIEAVLTVVSLDEIELEGAGDIDADLSGAASVRIELDGAGDVDGTGIAAGDVEVHLSGAGHVELSGRADTGRLEVSGLGDIDASDLELRDATAAIGGAGDIHVYATSTLDARISGAGDIHVSGDPTITREVSGAGDIVVD